MKRICLADSRDPGDRAAPFATRLAPGVGSRLRYRERLLAEWDRLDWRHKLDLLWRSTALHFGMRSGCKPIAGRTR